MCGSPSTGFSPPPGTVLPASATVYLFVVNHDFEREPPAIGLEVDGARFTARRIATMPQYEVVRIDLASSSREVVIRWKSEHAYDATEVRYPVGSPAPGDVHVTGVSDTHTAWACSHTDTIDITLTGNAIAYRLDWSDGTSDVVPANLGVLWGRYGRDEAAPSSHQLALGFVSCMGDLVEPGRLATLRTFRLVALFADGSERRLGPASARLDHRTVRLPWELLRATTADGPPEPLRAPVPARPTPPSAAPAPSQPGGDPRPTWPMIGALAGLAAAAAH